MKLKNSSIHNILIFSLTNIGDVILTCPTIDVMLQRFPEAAVDVVVGPKAVSLFTHHPRIKTIVFDKKLSWDKWFQWVIDMRRKRYDVVIDLRQTMFPLFFNAHRRTPIWSTVSNVHSREKHVFRLKNVFQDSQAVDARLAIVPEKVDLSVKDYIVIAPGSASSDKRWPTTNFISLARKLLARGIKIVWVGDQNDTPVVKEIMSQLTDTTIDLTGRINLRQLAGVLAESSLAITHDSGPMHMASYLNIPVLVLWGPTDIQKYGPWSDSTLIVRRSEQCQRCAFPNKKDVPHNCMSLITVEDVIDGFNQIKG